MTQGVGATGLVNRPSTLRSWLQQTTRHFIGAKAVYMLLLEKLLLTSSLGFVSQSLGVIQLDDCLLLEAEHGLLLTLLIVELRAILLVIHYHRQEL